MVPRQKVLLLASNARLQARREAGATEERTLYAVACMPWFGDVVPLVSWSPPEKNFLFLGVESP
jgi:hypothetical protein